MKRPLKYLVIHCTATPEGMEVSPETLRGWHLLPHPNGRGWKQVGYTDMVLIDGTIVNLVKNNNDEWVDNWEITNGVKGYNGVARHIVYVGGMNPTGKIPKNTLTVAQDTSLIEKVKEIIKQVPDIEVCGHNQFANKACPSFNVRQWAKKHGISDKNICKFKVNL